MALAIRYLIMAIAHRLVFTFSSRRRYSRVVAEWVGIFATVLGLWPATTFSEFASCVLAAHSGILRRSYAVTPAVRHPVRETASMVRQFEQALEQERHHLAGNWGRRQGIHRGSRSSPFAPATTRQSAGRFSAR